MEKKKKTESKNIYCHAKYESNLHIIIDQITVNPKLIQTYILLLHTILDYKRLINEALTILNFKVRSNIWYKKSFFIYVLFRPILLNKVM